MAHFLSLASDGRADRLRESWTPNDVFSAGGMFRIVTFGNWTSRCPGEKIPVVGPAFSRRGAVRLRVQVPLKLRLVSVVASLSGGELRLTYFLDSMTCQG